MKYKCTTMLIKHNKCYVFMCYYIIYLTDEKISIHNFDFQILESSLGCVLTSAGEKKFSIYTMEPCWIGAR